ncbi:MAG: BlaI/MecI/CopY family transcriptional regulator [Thermoanaerobaculia bacterium]
MTRSQLSQLSRRERQIMDILLELGEAPAEEVRIRLPDPPSYSAARAMLRKLEEKGMVRHREQDLRYVYRPAISREEARESAITRLVRVFFDGSTARAVNALVDRSASDLSDEELDRLARAVEDARARRAGR